MLLPALEVKVKNGVAYAQNSKKMNSKSGRAITLSVPKDALQSIESRANGEIYLVSGFNAEIF